MSTLAIIILVLLLLAILPAWPYSRAWGYGPSGLVGLILIVALLVILL